LPAHCGQLQFDSAKFGMLLNRMPLAWLDLAMYVRAAAGMPRGPVEQAPLLGKQVDAADEEGEVSVRPPGDFAPVGPELRAARAEGLPVSVETCPHYLHFCAEEIRDGATLCKCAPPIRSRENRAQLWQGLQDGVIDLVVTDHSPCPPAMKRIEEKNFSTAWGGIASLSMALPVMWTEAGRRGLRLTDLARWMSEGPAQLAGCGARKGRIAPAYDADFIVFDPEREFVVSEDRLHYRHAVSPYLGEKLRGVVHGTYLRGQTVFRGNQFSGQPRGIEIHH